LRLDQHNPPDVRLVFQNPALLGSLTIEENVGFLLKKNKNLSKKLISINDLRTPFGVNQQVLITLLSEFRILLVVIPFKNFLASFPVTEKQSNF